MNALGKTKTRKYLRILGGHVSSPDKSLEIAGIIVSIAFRGRYTFKGKGTFRSSPSTFLELTNLSSFQCKHLRISQSTLAKLCSNKKKFLRPKKFNVRGWGELSERDWCIYIHIDRSRHLSILAETKSYRARTISTNSHYQKLKKTYQICVHS